MLNSQKTSNTSIFLYLISLYIYLCSLTPTMYWGDSAEFSGTSFLLDIPHQPAYPLYNLIGKLFSFLPVGNIGFRINLLSLFFSTLTSIIIYLIFIQIFKSLEYKNNKGQTIAFIGTLLYSFSYTFWNQSTFAEVYTLFVFIASSLILILLVLRNQKDRPDVRLFYLFIFICGISTTHHLLILPVGSAFLFFIIIHTKLRTELFRKIILISFLFILPLTIYLYLPLRSAKDPYLDWGNPETFFKFRYTLLLKSPDTQEETMHPFLRNIWREIKNIHILALNLTRIIFILPLVAGLLIILQKFKNLRKYIFYIIYLFLAFSFVFSYFFIIKYIPFFQRVQGVHDTIFIELVLREFPLYILLLAIPGTFFLLKKDINLFLFFIFLFFLSTVFIIFRLFPQYRPYDHYRFFVVGNLILTIFITFGIWSIKIILDKFKIKYLNILPIVFFAIALFFIFTNNYKIVNKKDYYFADDFTKNILSSVSSNSLILIDGVDIYFLLYSYFSNKNAKDKKFVFLDNITTEWYFEKLKREDIIPKRVLFSSKLTSEKVIDDIIDLNSKKYKIYYTGTASGSLEKMKEYCLEPEGLAYLVLPDEKNCTYTLDDIERNKKLIYHTYKYRGIKTQYKDRKATGASNLYGNLHFNLARMYLYFNKTDNAIKELKKAIELFPQGPSNYEILAEIYYKKGDILSAIENLKKAIEYDKENVYFMNRLGFLYIDKGELLLAEETFKKCLKIYPEFFESHYNLGVVYQMKGEIDKAIRHFEIAKEIQPKHIAPYLSLGEIYYKKGDIKLAEKYFKEVLKIKPDNEIAKKYLQEISTEIFH